ncbi:MAG: 50S ribosomal protein L15 [Candidatus Ryanbacteria bacterium CG10_big_fil_rev_8_21_14_0_10_43_42]|uniref:Large ribosomal subunit protein uL15 n=1 Tax=Candidatus Ryanbacteria bacterium CG10_big_fil_rev_8_21_14_0_10_43_42 TaxID=1974864 RepID=A0A2M8KXY5_9BACT|nr:MAG: 50S ribosomal protein L15 [Candidatus Ryanbacteria bacterium CG10_big_fil_rev_8_21_14_0_10_43_42]
MQLHILQPDTESKTAKRVGRGGKRGTYSGRGIKGQKARAGRRVRPQLRDIIKKIPKKRGYKFPAFRIKPTDVNVGVLELVVSAGDVVTPVFLIEKGLIQKLGGKIPFVKILGYGELTKKITVEGCEASKGAVEKIEKAGGTILPANT